MEQIRRLRKKDATHRRIMHSAKLLFEKNGISNVTIEQIAESADVSRSTFFTHFESLDDLLTQIADEEIKDIFEAAEKDGNLSVDAVMRKLTEDTYPYPYLMSELFVRSILSGKDSSISDILSLIRSEIESSEYKKILESFSSEEISALIFGAYFGLVFRKLIDREAFENPYEIYDKIQQFIKLLKNQEEQNNE